MLYLVVGANGPGFAEPDEVLEILEKGINPTFDALLKLQESGRIVAGGLPVGSRTFVFIANANSHDDLDNMLRDLPAWGMLDWEITPLQSLAARAKKERKVVKELKKG